MVELAHDTNRCMRFEINAVSQIFSQLETCADMFNVSACVQLFPYLENYAN